MGTISRIESGHKVSAIGNERGVALIIVLVMLLLLTILGTSMLATSTTELKIAGNYRNSEEAFYTAEAALEFASVYSVIYTTVTPDSTFWPAQNSNAGIDLGSDLVSHGANTNNNKNPDFQNYNRITFISANGNQNTADVKVEYLYDGNPPAGCGIQEDSSVGTGTSGYKANYYNVSVIGYGPNDTVTSLESQAARIVPK